jgi:hypothetical protein
MLPSPVSVVWPRPKAIDDFCGIIPARLSPMVPAHGPPRPKAGSCSLKSRLGRGRIGTRRGQIPRGRHGWCETLHRCKAETRDTTMHELLFKETSDGPTDSQLRNAALMMSLCSIQTGAAARPGLRVPGRPPCLYAGEFWPSCLQLVNPCQMRQDDIRSIPPGFLTGSRKQALLGGS